MMIFKASLTPLKHRVNLLVVLDDHGFFGNLIRIPRIYHRTLATRQIFKKLHRLGNRGFTPCRILAVYSNAFRSRMSDVY